MTFCEWPARRCVNRHVSTQVPRPRRNHRPARHLGEAASGHCPRGLDRPECRGAGHPPADDRPRPRPGATGDMDRRQHARLRGLRLERGTGHRRRPDRSPPRRARSRRQAHPAPHGRGTEGQHCSMSSRASRPTARNRSSSKAAMCARARSTTGPTAAMRTGKAPISTVTASAATCARPIRTVNSSNCGRRRRDPGPAGDGGAPARGPGPVLQALSRRSHRQLRRSHASRRRTSCPTTFTTSTATFRYQWAPEPQQAGAGHYPGSAPETRAVLDFATRHPNIMVWLNLHTFGGVLIRPLGDKPDAKMDQGDLSIFEQVEAWMTEHTGYANRQRLPRVPVRARQAPARGPVGLRLPPARGPGLRGRALGPLPATRHRAQEALRRPLREVLAQGHAGAGRVRPPAQRRPDVQTLEEGRASAAR